MKLSTLGSGGQGQGHTRWKIDLEVSSRVSVPVEYKYFLFLSAVPCNNNKCGEICALQMHSLEGSTSTRRHQILSVLSASYVGLAEADTKWHLLLITDNTFA